MKLVIHAAIHGDGCFNLCTQPHPAPESNQSEWGQVRLRKPGIIHTL